MNQQPIRWPLRTALWITAFALVLSACSGSRMQKPTARSGSVAPAAAEATPPQRPAPLEVPGFESASHVGPALPERGSGWPRPVVVVLHGNFDRPEWECGVWQGAARFHGWLLCPRGIRASGASLAQDRWTYRSEIRVAREIEAGLQALETRYPGKVSRENMVLAGFSLGAAMTPGLAINAEGAYKNIFLVEGGLDELSRQRTLEALRAAGVEGVGMAMGVPRRRRRAEGLIQRLEVAGFTVAYVDMEGAGHGYLQDFPRRGREALRALLR